MINEIMTYEEERAIADVKSNISDVHVLIDTVQPVFQMAHNAAMSDEEQALVIREWESLNNALATFKTINQTAIDIMNNLRKQKNVHAQELRTFVNQLRQAAIDNDTGEPDIYEVDTASYAPEIQNLIESVEHRVHVENEIYFERDYAKLNNETYKSILADMSAMIAIRLDEHNLNSGKLLFNLFNNTAPLPVDQRAHVASILRRLANHVEAQS